MYVIFDGRRIAYRGQPGTSEAGTWVSVVPGFTVPDEKDGEGIQVYFDGKIVQ
jgi:hypothetical protein